MISHWHTVSVLVAAATLLATTEPSLALEFSEAERKKILQHSPLPAPKADRSNAVAEDPAAAHFGQFLFYDTRLSADGEVSCATCHDPEQGWGDGRAQVEIAGLFPRQAPTLWNTAYNRWFFWDGRADSQWAQALGPLENPLEHATSRLEVAHLIYDDPALRSAYEGVFGAMPNVSDLSRFPASGRPVPDDRGRCDE